MAGERVRAKSGAPILDDFTSPDGTPIVVDTATAIAYILDDTGAIVPLANGSAGSTWTRLTAGSSMSVAQGENYILCASSITPVLPASIILGGPIGFVTETALLTGIVINRNGNTIMALAENMAVDPGNWFFQLVGDDATSDWRLF